MASKRLRAYLRGDKEREIFDYVMNNPRSMGRTELAEKILAGIDWEGKPPELEVLLRKISRYRNLEPDPEDKPWHMSTLGDYPHSPTELAAIMKAYSFALRNKRELTIREAKWIGRLCKVVKAVYGSDKKNLPELNIAWGLYYATAEIWDKEIGEPFDTTFLDDAIGIELAPEDISNDDLVKLSDRNVSEEDLAPEQRALLSPVWGAPMDLIKLYQRRRGKKE